MAVVQISRVQVRRGRKNSGTSIPQLASGEMGWAIDSQELFIGNGSIQEGAPYVGNTKILTEHDNILDLITSYEYKRTIGTIQTGPTIGQPVQRSIQDRLDDIVTINNFLTDAQRNNSALDRTASLQRALDELYLNGDELSESSRVVLILEPGVYQISASIKIPPYAVIQGAGKDKTVIIQTGDFPVFQTVGSTTVGIDGYTGLVNMTAITQSRFVEVSSLTLKTESTLAPVLMLDSAINCYFDNVKFQGSWAIEDAIVETNSCLQIRATSPVVVSSNNRFVNCDFVDASYAINSTYDIESNIFDGCYFYNLGEGVIFGQSLAPSGSDGRLKGPCNNSIINSTFDLIARRGMNIVKGRGNISQNNKYYDVGNNGGDSKTAAYTVLHFGEGSNLSDNDYFKRSDEMTNKSGYLAYPYISEVSGVAKSNHKFNVQLALAPSAVNSVLIRLPGNTSSRIRVHYFYQSVDASIVRQGTMYLTVDKFNNNVTLTDEYDVTGNGARFSALSFSANLEDKAVSPAVQDGNKETVFVRYSNSSATETGYINYWYEILS
jgi:hypothetical protein